MSSVQITVPKEYGYVLLTATSTFLLSLWHAVRVSPYRKAAGIPFPAALALPSDISAASPEKKKAMYLFNCAQRAHYNFIENYNTALPALLIGGLKYPVAASLVGVGWVVCRTAYAVGYTRRDKEGGKGRSVGAPFWLFQVGLYWMAGSLGYSLLMG
ncbi:membrane-associated proteins in eicosanoid and glutathione metabolism [Aulographum hederae CBS 113979]|uniref:Membrane-associated proteins in eicosanoid and glutathione metabolism n=1 Tax=Aulographum hederae CBS 113979 TaxID=1176131 RepID=A0A6G1HDH7_9PEZI|nr:membrane-associated proteins in eicosanoid and glutathione metabolism [Aulographum hederae CBS 113979]